MSADREFGDSEAKRIIERAAEIDDARALREIAVEAGISPAAVEQAIGERLQPALPRRSWLIRHPGVLISLVILAALLLLRL
jgi:hypothetical protein